MQSTKLSRLTQLNPSQCSALAGFGIATVEELLGSARGSQAQQSLAQLLEVSLPSLEGILNEGRELVDPEILEMLRRPVRRRPRGARVPAKREG